MLLRVRIQLLYCVYLFKLEYWLCICEHLQFELQNMKFWVFFTLPTTCPLSTTHFFLKHIG